MSRKVLQVLGHSAGGIARHVAQVAAALDSQDGLTVDVACPPGLPVPMPKPTFDLVIPPRLRGHRAAVGRLRRLIRTRGYSLVHAHGLRAGVDSALAARGLCEVVVTVHNLVTPEVSGRSALFDRLAEPLVVRLSDRTLAVSQQIAQHLERSVGRAREKIEVLYLGIGGPPPVSRARDEVRSELGVEEGRCLAVTVARLAPQKALPVLFSALRMAETKPLLALLGEGPLERELRDLCARLGLRDDVRFLGFRNDVADLVAAADVFCLSSAWEGVPLAVQEAMLVGTPVVATAVGGMNEIISDGRSGRLVPPGDAAALALAIDEVCSSDQLRTRLATQARADVSVRFSTEIMLSRLRTIYQVGPRAG